MNNEVNINEYQTEENKNTLTQEFIDNLKTTKYTDNNIDINVNVNNNANVNNNVNVNNVDIDEIDDNAETCAICLNKLENGNIIFDIPCKHKYHTQCLSEWLLNHSQLCPLCKSNVSENIK